MRRKYVSRRNALAAGAAVIGMGLAGCIGDDDSDPESTDEPERPARISPGAKDQSVTIGPSGPGIAFEKIVDIDGDYTPEGLAYNDGHIYTAERDSPCTVREYETDGTKTDEEFTFEDMRVDHPNTMDWVDGNLWLSDSSTMVTYVIDWEEKEVVDEIAQRGSVTGTWRSIIPDRNGDLKILFSEWLGERMWVVDLENALQDGTTVGNIENELRNGFWTNLQTCDWHDGHLITTTHSWVIKSRLPYIDQLNEGYPVTSYNVEWAYEFEDGDTLEQAIYNPDDDEYYLCDRGGLGSIYAGAEVYGRHRNKAFSNWRAVEGGYGGDAVIAVDDSGIRRLELTRGHGVSKVGWIDVWFYDNGDESNEVNVGVNTNGTNEFVTGAWGETEFGADRYAYSDGDEWYDTGVERADDAWIKFGWQIHQDRVDGYVSTSHGKNWNYVGTVEDEDATVNLLQIQNREGEARVGNWTLELQHADQVY